MMTQPKGLTSASGIDVADPRLEAYVSIMATDYTDGLAQQAHEARLRVPARAPTTTAPTTRRPREMANASCMAGMAFANAFLGVNHSMAHKLGAYHHLPHGVPNAVILTRVMRYNAAEVPTKMGTFPQYSLPQRRCTATPRCRRSAASRARTTRRSSRTSSRSSKSSRSSSASRRPSPTTVLTRSTSSTTLDEMTEQAFNDQCTGANPRYPLMSEIKELYLDAYYGREPQDYAVCSF